ncbi:MAG: lytic transglycosylase domain-containing protein [Gammaproteobacteria bacterium]|nr:lytic transglycosylase domain-containing protein [Gammaproteobacteria bacterium]
MFHKLLIAFFIISLWTSPSLADIYKFVDKKGVVTLTNRPSSPKYKLILRTRKAWQPSKYRNMTANRSLFNHTINLAARRFHLNQALIHAVIQAESGYNPNAVSKAGAVGLMQLMPDTARHYGVTDRHDPAQNVQGGSHYLSDLLRRFGNLKLALAAYNAGETAIARYGNRIPPYRETRAYVKKVLALFRQKVGKHLH